jgi:cation:H+ antiporter
MDVFTAWVEFGLALLLITAAGSQLARYGDIIATRTGLGATWVGLVLIATVTSLPELITGMSAVLLTEAPDIAVGTLLGSCVFNLMIIVVLDFLMRGETIYQRVSSEHILSAAFGVILIGVVGFSVLLAGQGRGIAIGHVGIYTPIILGVYLMSLRTVFQHDDGDLVTVGERTPDSQDPRSLHSAFIRFGVAGLVVVGAGIWLPFVGERMAASMGVDETFVGSLFIALATSLPELVVTIAAIRLGSFDLAMGNLFGSNLFNLLILVPEDLAYTNGPILEFVSPLHTISAVSAMVMTGIAMVGLIDRPKRRAVLRITWASLALLSIYLLNFYVLYLYGSK